MRDFSLKAFELSSPGENLDLRLIDSVQICAMNAAAGKQWLSNLIASNSICPGYFYRFEGIGEFPEVRPEFVLNIAFHLFDDGRICPVRIWNKEERDAVGTAGPEWAVDFNGLPGWSLMASIDPRWHRLTRTPLERAPVGMSQRDWQNRDCWTVRAPAPLTPPQGNYAPAVAELLHR